MEESKKSKFRVSRRKFLGTSAAAAAVVSVGSLSTRCTTPIPPSATGTGIPNSTFGGVHIGAITYSWRSMEGGIDNQLKYCIESGISDIELMSTGIEEWCGAPETFRAPRRPRPAPEGEPQPEPEYTEEEYAAFEQQAAESQAALSEWRKTASMDKFTELGQMFRDAGVNIHIVKWSPLNWSEDDLDYAFRTAQAIGAKAVCNEAPSDEAGIEAAGRMGAVAEKYDMYAVFHQHAQYAEPEYSHQPFLDASPANMLNFDCGHYFGSTGKSPVDFINENHARIFSIHLKDKTGPNTDPSNTNQVWGQGENPLREVLLLLKEHAGEDGWPIYGDIELEYPIAPWSNAVKEVRTCVNYARQILI